jgi:hypothetical protein
MDGRLTSGIDCYDIDGTGAFAPGAAGDAFAIHHTGFAAWFFDNVFRFHDDPPSG